MSIRKKKQAALAVSERKSLPQRFIRDIRKNWILYLLMLPGFLSLILFKIGPVGGMVIAFEKFSAFQGVFGSKWVWFDNFKRIFQDPYIPKVVINTIILAVLSVVVVFPIPIIFSLFLNEIRQKWVRSAVQTLRFMPYFKSATVMVSILSRYRHMKHMRNVNNGGKNNE